MLFLALYIFARLFWSARETLVKQPPGFEGGCRRHVSRRNACSQTDCTIERQVKNSIARPLMSKQPAWRHYRNWFTPGSSDIHICCFHFTSRLNARSQTMWAIRSEIWSHIYKCICISHVVTPICDIGRRTFRNNNNRFERFLSCLMAAVTPPAK